MGGRHSPALNPYSFIAHFTGIGLGCAKSALKKCARVEGGAVEREWRELDRFRVKTIDLMRFLTERPFDAETPGSLVLDAHGSHLRPMVPLQ